MIDKSALKQQILFSDLTDTELGLIAKKMTVEQYAKGKTIFKEGTPTKGIYLVHKGKVEVSKITADGWKQTLAMFPETHFFGELSVVEDKKAHGVDATAVDNSEVYELTKDDFKSFEKSDPAMMYKIMRVIARVAGKNLHTMNERLMKLLISY
jgi:CRP/FNR family transcriptional regulator